MRNRHKKEEKFQVASDLSNQIDSLSPLYKPELDESTRETFMRLNERWRSSAIEKLLLITFQDRVHCASVERIFHSADEKLFRPLRQVVNDQLMMNWNRLHNFVNYFSVDLRAHNIDLWPVRLRDSNESHPIAVSHLATEAEGNVVVQTEAMPNL